MAELTILDGAMGAMLRAAGLRPGERPEIFGMEHPEIVEKIHRAYVEAGSRVIHANTSGANAHRLADTGCDVEKVISVNVAAAKRAAAGRAKVALAVGPVGERLEPRGTLPFDAAYEVYAQMVRAGEQAGADLVAFESMSWLPGSSLTCLSGSRWILMLPAERLSVPPLAVWPARWMDSVFPPWGSAACWGRKRSIP